jgi:vacuolar-type H+-ATPase subunit H
LDGERELRQVFSQVLQHIKARESDLVEEIHSIKKTAGDLNFVSRQKIFKDSPLIY